jgi:hypothetical protein
MQGKTLQGQLAERWSTVLRKSSDFSTTPANARDVAERANFCVPVTLWIRSNSIAECRRDDTCSPAGIG